jgi:serine/threonine protein kinase
MSTAATIYGTSMADYEVVKELGKGSYGTVFLVKLIIASGKQFVLKKISIKHMS